jgi:hypothetical protein
MNIYHFQAFTFQNYIVYPYFFVDKMGVFCRQASFFYRGMISMHKSAKSNAENRILIKPTPKSGKNCYEKVVLSLTPLQKTKIK